MNRPLKIALVLIPVALLAAYLLLGRSEPEAPAPAAVPDSVTYPQGHAPAAPDQPVGGSCSVDCSGSSVAITCAEGETPVCDCAATPASQCLPPAAAPAAP